MGLSFIYPEMLLLLLILAAVWALALSTPRRLGLLRFWASLVLRSTMIIALVLALAGTQLNTAVSRQTTIFLLDSSASITTSARAQAEAFIADALAAMPADDQAAVIVFGGDALVERAPSFERELLAISAVPVLAQTDIAEAIELALALFPADSHKRLVLLSDGGENVGDARAAAHHAAARQVPITIMDLGTAETDPETRVTNLRAPSTVRAGQEAHIDALIESTTRQRAKVRLLNEDKVLAEHGIDLVVGTTPVRFTVQVEGSGFQRYRVEIVPAGDGYAVNNQAATLIQVQGPPQILLIASQPDEAASLRDALAATEIAVTVVAPADAPTDLAGLSAYEAIFLVNVPVRDLPIDTLATLPTLVRDLGRGLVMIGGDESYGVGGYGNTPIETALPVTMEVRDREERPDLALIFVIDKSGSMDSCHCSSPDRRSPITGRAGNGPKIDIAREAVAQASAVLGPQDTVGIVAFDRQAQLSLPATRGASQNEVQLALASLEPRGTTNVRSGLRAAEDMLQSVDARIKHVILLTDGWGSGGSNLDVAVRLQNAGATLSVVAAGGGSAEYLAELAERGGGRYYAADDMADVPQIFVQETITTLGNYIIERPFQPMATSGSPLLEGIDAVPTLYGYNGSTLKETARLHLMADDESPLLATWQYGLGRSAAWLSDAKSQWARDWVAWGGFPRFIAQLTGAVLPARGSDLVTTDVRVEAEQVHVQLALNEEAQSTIDAAATLLVTATLIGSHGEHHELTLHQVAPGRYGGQLASPPSGVYLVQVAGSQLGQSLVQDVAGLVVPYPAEYRGGQHNPHLLDDLAQISGGHRLLSPIEAFAPATSTVRAAHDIALPLLLLALALLPLDIALRRFAIRSQKSEVRSQ